MFLARLIFEFDLWFFFLAFLLAACMHTNFSAFPQQTSFCIMAIKFFFLFLDPNIFADIDIDQLKASSKAYMNIQKSYGKKIKKLEKDAEKVPSFASKFVKSLCFFLLSYRKLRK